MEVSEEKQTSVHAYDSAGHYVGIVVATAAQLSALELTAGDAPPPDPAAELALERAGMVCSRFQAKAALMQAGLLPEVEAAIAGADAITQLAWAEAVELRRNSPMVAALAQSVGLSDTEVDDLFRAAAQIVA